jgi:raffinose/stachyose/melibiose transport system substrate-binding protein
MTRSWFSPWRRRTRTIAAGALCIAGLVVVVSSSGAAGATAAAASGGGNLNLWQWQGGTNYIPIFQNAANRYSKQYGGKVSITNVPFTSYFTKFKTGLAGGNVPDLLEMSWTGDYTALIQAGDLRPLNAYLKSGFPAFNSPVMKSLTYKGKIYGIPMDLNTLSIAYNEAIFTKLGLQVPKTFGQLLALAKPIRAAGYQPLAVNEADGWPGGDLWFAQVAYTDPTHTLIQKADQGQVSWDNPAFVKAAQNIQDMQSAGLVADGSSALTYTSATALFGSGQAAMFYPAGNFGTSLINQADNGKFQYSLFPFPPLNAGGSKPLATGGPAIIWSIPTKSANPTGAINYIRETTNSAAQALLEKNDFIPSAAKVNATSNTNPIYKLFLKFQPTAQTRAIFVPAVNTELDNEVQALLGGQATPTQLAQALETAYKSASG